jgi:hypothetical protein
VLQETDNEYHDYLELQKKRDLEFEAANNELDDYFFTETSKHEAEEGGGSSAKRDVEAEEALDVQEEEDLFKKHLTKTIDDYEKALIVNNFKNENEKLEMKKLV